MFKRYIEKIKKAAYAEGYLAGRKECSQCMYSLNKARSIYVHFDKEDAPFGVIRIDDQKYDVYLCREELHLLRVNNDGSVEHKRTFTLIEK